MKLSKRALLALFTVLALVAAACGGDAETATTDSADTEADAGDSGDSDAGEATAVRAAFIVPDPIGEAGWNFTHDQGRLAVEAATGVETAIAASIPANSEEFNNVVQNFIDDGFNVIFGASFDYQFAMADFAADNPDVRFEHISGFLTNETNYGNTFGRIYQARFIAGMAAGAETETNRIGYVAAFPIPEVIRGINAFALGVAETNPDAVVEVVLTGDWFDPGLEGNSAQALIDNGADVLTMHQDSTATGQAISEAGGVFIGYHSDMSELVDAYLTAPGWDWGDRYVSVVQEAIDGNFEPTLWWGGMADGVVDIEIPSSSPVAAEMQDVKDSIIAGDFDVWDQGVIADQDGNVIIEDGVMQAEILNAFPDDDGNFAVVASPGDDVSDGVLLNMTFFVDNVERELPG